MISGPRFDRRYGKGAFARLRQMLQDASITYIQIGSSFGLTKQRVSQLAQCFGINGKRRVRERIKGRFLDVSNEHFEYPFRVRLVLAELARRQVLVETRYTVNWQSRVARKHLTTVLVNGVPCKIRYHRVDKANRFAQFVVSPHEEKVRAVVLGVRCGSKFRLYVIPYSKLNGVKQINIPVTGEYKWTWGRPPKRDWTRFENAWHLLR